MKNIGAILIIKCPRRLSEGQGKAPPGPPTCTARGTDEVQAFSQTPGSTSRGWQHAGYFDVSILIESGRETIRIPPLWAVERYLIPRDL